MPKTSKTPARDEKGRFISVTKEKVDLRKKELPLVDIKVTNPVTYLKSWWKRVMGKEGVDFRFKVHPLTAIAITIIVVSVVFGLGRFVLPFKIPFFEQTPAPKPTPAGGQIPLIFRDTAFSGILKYSSKTYRYYLLTSQSEAINLQVPENVELKDYLGERVFATGKYNQESRTLVVGDAKNLELLPQDSSSIPTSTPTPTPTPFPTVEPTETPTGPEATVIPLPTETEELPEI